MIEMKALTKVYATEEVETTALNEVDLTIAKGSFTAIMGPSGCGKSTLLNIIGLLDTPSSGSYQFDGTEIAGMSERERAKFRKGNIGFIFQSFNLIDELTVYENIELPLQYIGLSKVECEKRVHAALEKVQMMHRKNHYPQQLSGGQQQRVAIARAVVANPSLLLADEPTGNLDSVHGQEVMELLTELNKSGSTIVMVTHSNTDAAFANRIIRLFDGHIVEEQSLA
ncbi:ABC transporter ATP-binding protein [bacterium]|nr:MAG: ABC transporter ATP-binding protein [bacterium]